MTRVEVNGLHLNIDITGDGFPLLALHGFTGSAMTWQPFAESWPQYRIMAVELIGHGASDAPADESRYTMARCTADLAALLAALDVERAALLGYSMGGRVALQFALAAPERVAALVLESASSGIDDAGERAARAAADRALADSIEREGIQAFVDRWEALPMWATHAALPEPVRQRLRAQRLRNSTAGLANSLRGMGAGAQEPVLNRLHELRMPVLLIAGEQDAKYRQLAYDMRERIRDAHINIVEGAGHAAHLERPAAFAPLVKEFLTACLQQNQQPASSDRP